MSWDLSYCTGIPLMFAYGPESYDLQTWGTARDKEYLLDNNLLSHKLACMAGGASQMTPSPAELLHQLAQACSSLQHIHHVDPTPNFQLTGQKRTGPTLTLCPASIPRKPNLGPPSLWAARMVMMVTQHPKRAASLKKKMRWTPKVELQMMIESLEIVRALVVAPLMGKVLGGRFWWGKF